MKNRKEVKKYVKYYKKLIKSGMHGAAGFVETKEGEYSTLEIAARYLSQKGMPIFVYIETQNGIRRCYVTIKRIESD